MVSFKGYRSQFDAGTVLNFCLMGLGCPLLLGLSARRLRRCAATKINAWKFSMQLFVPQFNVKTNYCSEIQ